MTSPIILKPKTEKPPQPITDPSQPITEPSTPTVKELKLHKAFNFLGDSLKSDNVYPLSPLEAEVLTVLKGYHETPYQGLTSKVAKYVNTQFTLPTDIPTTIPLTEGWSYYKAGTWYQGEPDYEELHLLDFETSRLWYTGGMKKGPKGDDVIDSYNDHQADVAVGDAETCGYENKNDWSALCAVAISPDGTIFVWLAPTHFGVHYAKAPAFVAHNASFDLRWTSNNPYSICTQGLSAALFSSLDDQLDAVRGNPNVPWAPFTLPPKVSLLSLAEHLKIEINHDKQTRDLCIYHLWSTNRSKNMEQIVLYCLQDTLLLGRIWNVLQKSIMKVGPNLATWHGLFEISQYRLPVSATFHAWVRKTYDSLDEVNERWADRMVKHLHAQYHQYFAWVQLAEDLLAEMLTLTTWLKLFYVKAYCKRWCKLTKKGTRQKHDGTHLQKLWEYYDGAKFGTVTFKALTTELAEGMAAEYHWLKWGVDGSDGYYAPEWVKSTTLRYSSKTLWVALGVYNTGNRVLYAHPHYTNCLKKNNKPVGAIWSKNVESIGMSSDWDGFNEFREYAQVTHAITSLRERLETTQIHSKDGHYWFYPDIHRNGTVTGRLTDSVVMVGVKHNKNIPGSELLGVFEAPPGWRVLWADYSGQETLLFSAFCDAFLGTFGASEYSQIILTADLHTVIRDLLEFEPTKDGRQAAKNYTFLLQYGGGEKGCYDYLILAGYSPEVARRLSKNLVGRYVGNVSGRGRSKRYSGGIASAGYNFLQRWIYNEVPRTFPLNRAVPIPLRPKYTQENHELTLKNFPCQSGGVDMLHLTNAAFSNLSAIHKMQYQPLISIHDRPGWLVKEEEFHMDIYGNPISESGLLPKPEVILQAAHLEATAAVYASLNLDAIPKPYAFFDGIDIDNRLRLDPLSLYDTPSNPGGFPIAPWNVEAYEAKLAKDAT